MIKKDKKLFITLILLCFVVLALVFFFWLCEDRSESSVKIENRIESLAEQNAKLNKENKKLSEEIEELEDEINLLKSSATSSEKGSLITYQQSMIDLSDISLLIKEGKIEDAKKELLKINTNGFDFTALSFYESLCRELNINAK